MNDVPMIPTLINGQWQVLLPEHRAVRPEWYTETGWERARLGSMHHHLTALCERATGPDIGRRPVIIDVGVEEGDLTALYSQWGCDVVMVEPNPKVWPNVRAIWEANGLRDPLYAFVGFAGDACDYHGPGHAQWFDTHVGPTHGWPRCAFGDVIGDHAFLHLAQHPHVPTQTLDYMMALAGVNVDAITMDVEGSELTVLRGAEGILADDRPLVWVSVHTDAQWMDENYPLDGRAAVLEWMAKRDYAGTLLAIDHEEHWFFQPIGRMA